MKILEKRLERFGSKPGLSRIRRLLKEWGNPQNKLKVILVSGTNGKGSTVSYLSSILQEAGFKVGSYYSPHLIRYNERIRINGEEIKSREFTEYRKRIFKHLKKVKEITLFEALTAIAFQYFADKKCDYAIMEIGMGGRLDACNIAQEEMAIVTNIEKEHVRWLGEKEEEIAFEKIGILKKGIGITGAKGKALGVIKKEAKKRNRILHILGKDFSTNYIRATEKNTIFDYFSRNANWIKNKKYKNIKLEMLGEYQAENAALAIKAAEELGIKEKTIRKGLKKAKLRGRMEILSKKPLILIDVAHNPAGIKELLKNLEPFKHKKLTVVFGVMQDKDWKKMIKLLDGKADEIILTKPKYYRAEDPNKINNYLNKSYIIKNSKGILNYIKRNPKKNNLILITGSIYFVGEILGSV